MQPSSPMDGYHDNTGGCHPNLLREQGRRSAKLSDTLRRMAIRNSYETRSLGGTSALCCTTTAPITIKSPAGHLLPPISKRPPAMQRGRRKGERSVSPASLRCLEGRPRSSSDHLRVLTKKDLSGSLKRSSSQSSVAVNKTTPTIQTGTSSYVYHTPSGRKISRGNRRAYENIRLQKLQDSSMKRSSSCSTVIANTTSTKASEDQTIVRSSPAGSCSDKLPGSSSQQDHAWRHRNGTITGSHSHHGTQNPSHNKACEPWSPSITTLENQYPRVFKHIEHTNFTCSKATPHNQTESRHSPKSQFPVDSNYRSSFQTPQSLAQYDRSIPITRFGSSPVSLPAMGIVPQLMSPRCQTAATQTKARRVRLHTPRGKKVASLV